jgi:hypothetical protein
VKEVWRACDSLHLILGTIFLSELIRAPQKLLNELSFPLIEEINHMFGG